MTISSRHVSGVYSTFVEDATKDVNTLQFFVACQWQLLWCSNVFIFSEIAETIFSGVLTLDICINFKYFEDSEEKGDLISESAKYEAVCRTAPAAMGLIKST